MEKSVGRLISILYRKNLAYLNTALRPLGLTSAEQPFLLALYRQNGLSQEELSAYLSIDKAATARAVYSLAQKGYVNKEKDCADKRYNRITLTEKALAVRPQILEKLHAWSSFVSEGESEQDMDTLFAVLERMAERAEHMDYKKE
jgi:DNA-binding MarR family transcriptional regulator